MQQADYRPVLLSPSDIAHLIGRPVGTVKRWHTEGRLTSYDGRYDWLELADVAEGRLRVPPVRAVRPDTAVPAAA